LKTKVESEWGRSFDEGEIDEDFSEEKESSTSISQTNASIKKEKPVEKVITATWSKNLEREKHDF
jgi:hypothetical protein